jgi:acyl-ACP thioesterase
MKRPYTYRIEPYQADLTQRLTLMGLADYMLTASFTDALFSGYDSKTFGERCGWVLLRMSLEVTRLPKQLENITIRTWISDVNRLASTHNFEVLDEQGNIIARSSTIWAIIDLDSRKTLSFTDFPDFCNEKVERELDNSITPPLRLSTPDVNGRYTHQVLYSYIDGNGHTYSINYLRMALDTLDIKELTTTRKVRIDMNWMHETHYGERLTILTDHAPSPLFEIQAEDGTPAARLLITWGEEI